MSGRREVNVERPEHSWIPFYRELARKLVDPKEGWRGRQGELVGVLKEMRNERVMMHNVLNYLDEYVDPFTVFAIIARNMTPGNYRSVLSAYKSKFELDADLPVVKPFIPYIFSLKLGFFPGKGDIPRYVSDLWDLFELVWDTDPCASEANLEHLVAKFDDCKSIPGVGVAKLTSVFYIVNPEAFLKNDTINDVIGKDVLTSESYGADYFRYLKIVRSEENRSFPEINVSEYTRRAGNSSKPNVWVVRGGHDGIAVEEFLSGRYSGVGFRLETHDLSKFGTTEELIQFCDERGLDNYGVGQVFRFLVEIRIGDYVLMPGRGSVVNHFGRVVSDPYHSEGGTLNNRRDVDWLKVTIPRSELDLARYRSTLTLPNRERQESYLAAIKRYERGVLDDNGKPQFKMPEDSWVPFHWEAGRKLIEGEWWREVKRDEFTRMVHDIRWSDPGDPSEDGTYGDWSADPFSFYLSFNMRMVGRMREPAHERVKGFLDLKSSLPTGDYKTISLGVNWGWESPLSKEEFEFLWHLFRFVHDFDPANCIPEDERRFAEFYDRATGASFLPGRRTGWLSIWLYWINPTKYVATRRLARQALNLESELGVSAGSPTGQGYLDALRGLRDLGATNGFDIMTVNRLSTTRADLGLDDVEPDDTYTIEDMIKDGVFLEKPELQRIKDRFEDKKNLILQGSTGVGKTFVSKRFAYLLMGRKAENRIQNVQFHQSYSYEDFVQGFRPETNPADQLIFKLRPGSFLQLCNKARENPENRYVMIIDEINRGNLSRVFGELLSAIEKDKRGEEFELTLSSGTRFWVPKNVYILGTMNLADRSLAGMDYAMRRRFAFVSLKPQFRKAVFENWLTKKHVPSWMVDQINDRMWELNRLICDDDRSLGPNFAVGHSYFCDIPDGVEKWQDDDWGRWYREIVKSEIQTLLEEYWFDDPKKAAVEVKKLRGEEA